MGYIPVKNFWRLLKLFIRPMLILSLGLHGLLLAIPIPEIEDAEPEEAQLREPETIQVSRLPAPPEPEPEEPISQPEPNPEPEAPISQPELKAELETPISQPEPEETSPGPESEPLPEDSPPEVEPEPKPEETPIEPQGPENPPESTQDPPTLQERLKDSASYVYNSKGTTEEEATNEFSTWFTEIFDQYDLLPNKQDPIEIPYLLGECLPQLPQSASIGVIVNKDEEIITVASALVDNPHLLNSTGYGILDEQAIEAVESHLFPDESERQAYSFEVRIIDYDSTTCNPPTS